MAATSHRRDGNYITLVSANSIEASSLNWNSSLSDSCACLAAQVIMIRARQADDFTKISIRPN